MGRYNPPPLIYTPERYMTSKIFIGLVLGLASVCAYAEKAPATPQTDEQCKKSVEKIIEDHKALSNPANPNSVPDDVFVIDLKKLQQQKGNCEAYNQLLDNFN
jgi:hypothetical protein